MLLFLVGLCTLPSQGQAPPPAWEQALDEGRDLLAEGKDKEAIKAFLKADEIAAGACVECQIGLATAFNRVGAHKEALKWADAALELTADTASLIPAYHHRGLALYALAGDDAVMLGQAEGAFRRALDLSGGTANTARLNLGMALLRQSRDAEGIAALKEYLENEPGATNAEEVRDLIANPLRARKRLAPDFELATLAGDYLTLDGLRGKVILLDFWGTWCGPCVAAVPHLRQMSRRMADEPFVLLSVSTDTDEAVLREFVAANGMDWPQVWDKDHAFTRKCKVNRFPTYVLVNHEGEIILAASWGGVTQPELRGKVAAAVRAAKESAKAN